MRGILNRAKQNPQRIVYPEGEHERIIRAAALVVEERLAQPVLLGVPRVIEERAAQLGISLRGIELMDPSEDVERQEKYALEFFQLRKRKGVTLAEAREQMRQAIYYGCMMVREGDADGLVAGEDMYYSETIRPALETIGTAPGVKRVAGLYLMVLQDRLLLFADTTVNIDPDAETLAEIATLSASIATKLGIEPVIGMLSFSTFGSARSPQSDKVRAATELVKKRHPELHVDGEMQLDIAVLPNIRDLYPFSEVEGPVNVLIFPDLNSANIAYKLMARLGGAEAIGPVLMGMGGAVHVLQRGSTAADILNLTALAVVDAQERRSDQLALGYP
jgi:malate dehydrogenase (oxaloacetate-decarboxylating)(NADP+)